MALTSERLAAVGVAAPGGKRGRLRRARRRRPVPARARLVAGCTLLVAGTLLLVAVPRVAAAFWLWLRAPVMDLVSYQEPVPARDLYGLIASRELALDWIDAGATHDDLAAALSVLASLEEPDSDQERAFLERALAETRASLARAPANPRGWAGLAYLHTLLTAEPDPQAAQALQLSLRTGPYERPDFLTLRLYLLLLHWPVMTPPERARTAGQMQLLWQEAPAELVRLTLEPGFDERMIAALAAMPDVQADFLDALRTASSPK